MVLYCTCGSVSLTVCHDDDDNDDDDDDDDDGDDVVSGC